MIRILFVCHGNICRSPMAEVVMKDLVRKAGRESEFEIASAATSTEEIGNPVYPPARRKLAQHGINCSGKTARQLTKHDYDHWDLLIGMDQANLRNMHRLYPDDPDRKLHLLLDYTDRPGEVADPWYTGNFDVTYDEDTDTLHEQTLLMLSDISSVYVPITISEEDILNVSIGQPATVTMNAFEDRTFDAEVDTLSVTAARSGASTVSYTVNVRYKGENELNMYEGMSADITLIQRSEEDVLYVNNQAITNNNGITTVLLQRDGETVETKVKTGFSDGQYVEIISGLEEGDVVLAQSGVSRA